MRSDLEGIEVGFSVIPRSQKFARDAPIFRSGDAEQRRDAAIVVGTSVGDVLRRRPDEWSADE